MTVFVSVSEWLGFAEADEANVTIADPSIFNRKRNPREGQLLHEGWRHVHPEVWRADVAPLAAEGNLTVNGSAVTEDGNVTVIGRGAAVSSSPATGRGRLPATLRGIPWQRG